MLHAVRSLCRLLCIEISHGNILVGDEVCVGSISQVNREVTAGDGDRACGTFSSVIYNITFIFTTYNLNSTAWLVVLAQHDRRECLEVVVFQCDDSSRTTLLTDSIAILCGRFKITVLDAEVATATVNVYETIASFSSNSIECGTRSSRQLSKAVKVLCCAALHLEVKLSCT